MSNSKLVVRGFVLSLIVLLSACSKISSDEVEASSVFGELNLKRSEGASSATASATFFVGGSTGTVIEMNSPASIKINGQTANEVNDPIINMTRYERAVSVSGDATLVYTDKEGGVYSNTLVMPGSLSMSLPGTVFKSQGFAINYSSSSGFVGGEHLEVILSGGNTSSFSRFSLVTGATSGAATIVASALADFAAGNLSVSICRESNPGAQHPYPKGTSITVKSCSSPRTVNLQP